MPFVIITATLDGYLHRPPNLGRNGGARRKIVDDINRATTWDSSGAAKNALHAARRHGMKEELRNAMLMEVELVPKLNAELGGVPVTQFVWPVDVETFDQMTKMFGQAPYVVSDEMKG